MHARDVNKAGSFKARAKAKSLKAKAKARSLKASALEALRNALYKFKTYLLTYKTTAKARDQG